MQNERVLVIDRDVMNEMGIEINGVLTREDYNFDYFLQGIMDNVHHRYVDRKLAETDENLKQLIPYCVFRHKDFILSYVRKGGEERLESLLSVGVGGHLNSEDQSYYNGLNRELVEEIGKTFRSEKIIGILNDDSNQVGRVHLGVVHLIDLPTKRDFDGINLKSVALHRPMWLPLPALKSLGYTGNKIGDECFQLENWSKLVVDFIL